MGSFSLWHWIIVLGIVLIVFGPGKLPKAMGDLAKGVQAFRKGLKDEGEAASLPESKASDTVPRA